MGLSVGFKQWAGGGVFLGGKVARHKWVAGARRVPISEEGEEEEEEEGSSRLGEGSIVMVCICGLVTLPKPPVTASCQPVGRRKIVPL